MESSGLSMLHTGNAPDLFGGDLFGDELMDMYNSDAVVVGNGDDSGGKFVHSSHRLHLEAQVPLLLDRFVELMLL